MDEAASDSRDKEAIVDLKLDSVPERLLLG